MAHATAISAITLSTKNMEASVKFYDLLGIKKTYETPTFVSYIVAPGQFINLQYNESFDPMTWGRVIIYVNDVDSFYNQLVSSGFKPEFEPTDAPWHERYFHIRDPAGQEISFAKPITQHQSM